LETLVAFFGSYTGKNSKYSEEDYEFQDLAISIFDIDTDKVKPLFSRDVWMYSWAGK